MRRAVLATGCILAALVALISGQTVLVPVHPRPLPVSGYPLFYNPYPEYQYPATGTNAGILGGSAFLFLALFVIPLMARSTVAIVDGSGSGSAPSPPIIVTPPTSG